MEEKLITGKDLERYWRSHDSLLFFHKSFNENQIVDERALAILAVAFLDIILENIITNFMMEDEKESKKLIGIDGAIGTYSNRITAVYCLGLVCKPVRDDLRTVGKIRNKFAHQLEVSFDTAPICNWCLSLKWHELSMMKTPKEATAQQIFQVCVNQLICYLNGIVGVARLERRQAMKI